MNRRYVLASASAGMIPSIAGCQRFWHTSAQPTSVGIIELINQRSGTARFQVYLETESEVVFWDFYELEGTDTDRSTTLVIDEDLPVDISEELTIRVWIDGVWESAVLSDYECVYAGAWARHTSEDDISVIIQEYDDCPDE
ncbi:hypothetical protein [Natronorubrum texcoconense]|uniref:hypothetical protein n=1 Tax=Natronorubrum texcoconense TaxID=1095776 RepID=UPI0011135400|nr:hypothetical protein [Natronorubrum texcoconense]